MKQWQDIHVVKKTCHCKTKLLYQPLVSVHKEHIIVTITSFFKGISEEKNIIGGEPNICKYKIIHIYKVHAIYR